MAKYENVSIFSQTTAEISKEYIDKFHEPNIIPNYLNDLSQKTGVELETHDGVFAVSGSWMSVNKAHSFLGKFLLRYGQTRIAAVSLQHETTYTKEEKDGICFPKSKIDDMGVVSSSNSTKGFKDPVADSTRPIDQDLPVDKLVVKSMNLTPEPVVLYAGYHATGKEMESQRKTLEVLKNVYKMEQNYQIALSVKKDDVNPGNILIGRESYEAPGDSDQTATLSRKTERFDQQDQLKMPSDESMNADQSEREEEYQPDAASLPAPVGYASSVDPQLMTSLTDVGIQESGAGRIRKSIANKNLTGMTEEEADAKRKKVESIAESILSQVNFIKDVTDVKKTEKSPKHPDAMHAAEIVKYGMEDNVSNGHDDDDDELEDDMAVCDDDGNEDEDNVNDHEDNDNDDDESDFEPDHDDQDTPIETEAESVDDIENDKISTSDNEYVPDEKVSIPTVKGATKMKTRLSKTRDELVSHADPSLKKRRGRSRKGFPMKLEVKESVKSSVKSDIGKLKNLRKKLRKRGRGRPKRQIAKDHFCSKCPYFAQKRSHLREHERRVHITKEFKCDYCDKIFGFGKDLKRHLKTHLKPQNCCDICGKLYKGVKSLVEHRRTHDDDYIKPEFECEICNKCFSTKYVLAYHIKSVHLGMKRTFMCPTCGKSFSQKNSYIQHANVHMGFKPYKCNLCDKAFSYEKSLKEHKFMHDDIRRFKCTVCEKTFRQSSAVSIHMKVHKETKDYVCMACGKGFSQKQALIRHERIHLGEKPFSCTLCGRTFTDSSILRRHMILIHKKDPKKWREDTVNNCIRRTDFFIDVLDGIGSKEVLPDTTTPMETSIRVEEGSLGTTSPSTTGRLIATSISEPINMTTTHSPSSAREQIHMQDFQDGQSVVEADESVDHPYSLSMQADSVAAVQNDQNAVAPVHILEHKMSAIPNPDVHPSPALPLGLQHSLEAKIGAGEFMAVGLPSHALPYMMGAPGGYPYSQAAMLPDPNSEYAAPPTMSYQQQYTDPNSSQQYIGYPPQS